jgi:hypothetical protein
MRKTEYIVQVEGTGERGDSGSSRDDKKRWFDIDKKGNDKKGAIDSWRTYKRTGVLPKVRLIERITIEKRLR